MRTIGSADPPGLLCSAPDLPGQLAAPSSGQIAVPGCDCGEVLIFQPGDQPARRAGRCGQGPGELEQIRAIVAAGDRLFVAGSPPKVLEFDPATGQLLQEITLPSYPQLKAVLPDGNLILAYPGESDDGGLHALHLHGLSGERIRSFQPIEPNSSMPMTHSAWFGLHALRAPEGQFWTVRAWNRYAIHGYDDRARPVARHVDAEWFRQYDEGWTAARAAVHAAVWRDGLIWIVAQRPLEWRDEPLSVEEMFAGAGPPRESFVAAIDPASGETIARLVLDRTFVGGADGLFYRPSHGADGTLLIEFFRPELVR